MMPVRPPNKKVIKNPRMKSIGVSKLTEPPHMVPIQLKNFTPVGTPIKKVMNEKNGKRTCPLANMWWAHTETESAAIPIVAATNPL